MAKAGHRMDNGPRVQFWDIARSFWWTRLLWLLAGMLLALWVVGLVTDCFSETAVEILQACLPVYGLFLLVRFVVIAQMIRHHKDSILKLLAIYRNSVRRSP